MLPKFGTRDVLTWTGINPSKAFTMSNLNARNRAPLIFMALFGKFCRIVLDLLSI